MIERKLIQTLDSMITSIYIEGIEICNNYSHHSSPSCNCASFHDFATSDSSSAWCNATVNHYTINQLIHKYNDNYFFLTAEMKEQRTQTIPKLEVTTVPPWYRQNVSYSSIYHGTAEYLGYLGLQTLVKWSLLGNFELNVHKMISTGPITFKITGNLSHCRINIL